MDDSLQMNYDLFPQFALGAIQKSLLDVGGFRVFTHISPFSVWRGCTVFNNSGRGYTQIFPNVNYQKIYIMA